MRTSVQKPQRRDERSRSALKEDQFVGRTNDHLDVVLAVYTQPHARPFSGVSEAATAWGWWGSPGAYHLQTTSWSFFGSISSMNGSSAGYCSTI